ncbi:MAG: WYL domain-containing protein, partial [Proteobacteria bacterium]|nr:WYL domain-containing protein [Pseudomonadota bacterium]
RKLHSTHFGRWHEKIRIIPRGQGLIPAPVDPKVLEVVYEALLQERQFQAEYRAREASASKTYRVHPLGLVFRHEIVYLVCTIKDYDDVVHLALHRFKSAEPIPAKRRIPDAFDLDEFIGRGEFSYPVKDEPIRLEAAFEKTAAAHLYETPLSEDQVLKEQDDGSVLLTATVKNTSELRWWLLGFGDKVEVLKPLKLRREFSDMFARLHGRYGSARAN